MHERALANKLAAVAASITEAARPSDRDLGPSDAAALLAVASRGPLTVNEIAAAAGISQSAAVRLVDRLERTWLVQRRRRLSREVLVDATQRGRKRAEQISQDRLRQAAAFLAALDAAERQALDGLLQRIASADPFDPGRDCRACDRSACDCGLHGPD